MRHIMVQVLLSERVHHALMELATVQDRLKSDVATDIIWRAVDPDGFMMEHPGIVDERLDGVTETQPKQEA